jgi:hypothetical protein
MKSLACRSLPLAGTQMMKCHYLDIITTITTIILVGFQILLTLLSLVAVY